MTETLGSDTAEISKTLASNTMEISKIGDPETLEKKNSVNSRVEIDTSPPFESVKEAVSRFGGSGVWRPSKSSEAEQHKHREPDIEKVEEEASLLEQDLIVKERETLEVLKELEMTKKLVEELKLKLQNEVSESIDSPDLTSNNITEDLDDKISAQQSSDHLAEPVADQNLNPFPNSSPGLILIELKQAKVNLGRTTHDLADIRASVELLNKKLEKERISLKKTSERLTSNSSKISSLEDDLNRTKRKLQLVKDAEIKGSADNPIDLSRELQHLNSEAEEFKKMAEAAKSEVLRATLEIEQTKTSIRTAAIRCFAARKMAEAARASEAVALAQIRALSSSVTSSGVLLGDTESITLSFEEYSSLNSKARQAEELSKKRVLDAEVQIDEANISKTQILRKVEEAAEEVKTSKQALEEALDRVEAANRGKLEVEEALRKWRSDHGQKRRSVHNSTKFKNSCPSQYRKDSRLINVNMLSVGNNGSKPVLKPTLSIGQILSRKLLMPDEVEMEMEMQSDDNIGKPKISLGQILGKQCGAQSLKTANEGSGHKQFSAKRKKFGFTRFSLLLTKQSKKKKEASPSTRWNTCKGEV